MKHIWIQDENPINTEVYFEYRGVQVDKLVISAAPFYTIFFDGKLVSFGPERTASGYSRIRDISIPEGTKTILIRVTSHGVPTYDCDFQDPFFGCDLFKNDEKVGDASSFTAYKTTKKVQDSTRYSYQRGFVERYDLRNVEKTIQEIIQVQEPVLLKGIGDTCDYKVENCTFLGKKLFDSFDEHKTNFWYKNSPAIKKYEKYNFEEQFVNVVEKNGWTCYEFSLKKDYSGLIKCSIESNEDDVLAFLVFDEYLDNGKWFIGRSSCCDIIEYRFNKGQYEIISSVPYTAKYIRVLVKKDAKITPSMILIQNDRIERKKVSDDSEIQDIYDAALNTYRQNAVDLFTDCPGRERAGWLCDSYFTAIGEKYFTGRNDIERCFLENIIISNTPEIDARMLPMCFPSEHFDYNYIPNWAMWFVLELDKYRKENNDFSLVEKAKKKVFDLVDYFAEFENEEGLLENLKKWVFVEWSISNSEEYIKGINFPTNMLYAKTLETIGELYNVPSLIEKSKKLKETIIKYSYDQKYFCDNAIREDGKIVPQRNHISETCQYYALFFEIIQDDNYEKRMLNEFSPKVINNPDGVGKSNVFIGYFVRFLWLMRKKEYKRFIEETKDYFAKMASLTGTLWEKDNPTASCNHGFTSCVAALLNQAIESNK